MNKFPPISHHLSMVTFSVLLLFSGIKFVRGSEEISSRDKFLIEYSIRYNEPLAGRPGSLKDFTFQLFNNDGNEHTFQIGQESNNEEMKGQLDEDKVIVGPWQRKDVEIRNLFIPLNLPEGQKVAFTLVVERLTEGNLNEDNEVRKKTILIYTDDYYPEEDDTKPEIDHEYEGTCPSDLDTYKCDNYQWQTEFHIKDDGVGLGSIDALALGRDSLNRPVTIKYKNFDIGTTEVVDVTAEVSCCVDSIEITAMDLQTNEADLIIAHTVSKSIRVETSLVMMILLYCTYVIFK